MKQYYPIGTLVSLKRSENILFLIVGLAVENSYAEKRDYVAVRYPLGLIEKVNYFFFDHIDIEKVVHMGYCNEDHESYVNLLNAVLEQKL